ncbi:MAG TPA: HAD-IIIA family hydrolase [Myxococcales bacterium]|jgi:D-glycero-D-manno-heptose 1,7-bisphosphate phosphatase
MSTNFRRSGRPRIAAFLDRDGVLVEILRDPELGVLYTAFHPDQLRPTKDAVGAVQNLRALGFECIVVSNQPGPAKGHFPLAQIDRMKARLQELFQLDAVYSCPHHPEGGPGGDPTLIKNCECRKPRPGMILQAARERGIDLAGSVMIGDSPDDVRAGKAAGVRTILLNGGRCELCPNRGEAGTAPDATVQSLPDAVAWLTAQER